MLHVVMIFMSDPLDVSITPVQPAYRAKNLKAIPTPSHFRFLTNPLRVSLPCRGPISLSFLLGIACLDDTASNNSNVSTGNTNDLLWRVVLLTLAITLDGFILIRALRGQLATGGHVDEVILGFCVETLL